MNTTEFLKILPAYVDCYTKGDLQFKKRIIELLTLDNMGRLIHRRNFKLILRSFDQITDEEKIQLNIICSDTKGMPTEPENWASKHVIYTINKSAQQINYLRSIGIDCDGLIEAGFAIKEETK